MPLSRSGAPFFPSPLSERHQLPSEKSASERGTHLLPTARAKSEPLDSRRRKLWVERMAIHQRRGAGGETILLGLEVAA